MFGGSNDKNQETELKFSFLLDWYCGGHKSRYRASLWEAFRCQHSCCLARIQKCQFTKLVYLLLQSIWIQQRKQRDITMLQRCSRRNPHPQNRRSSSAMSVCSWVRLCRPEKYESGSTGENEMWITCCSTPWPPWGGPKNEKGHLPGKQWNPLETTKTTTGKQGIAGIPSSSAMSQTCGWLGSSSLEVSTSIEASHGIGFSDLSRRK